MIFRELEKILGCTHALSNVNTPVRYADGLDESFRTRWLLVKYAQRTGDPKILVSIALEKFRCIMLLTSAYSRSEHVKIAGGLL